MSIKSESDAIDDAMKNLEGWLPHQGPIDVFIHHNTLAALEDYSFEQAVEQASDVLGAAPYMPHNWYLKALQSKRIAVSDLPTALSEAELRPIVGCAGISREDICLAALKVPKIVAPDEAIISLMDVYRSRSDGGSENRKDWDQGLWSQTVEVSQLLKIDIEIEFSEENFSHDANDQTLIQLCAAYFDRGIAIWPMPNRANGFYAAVREIYSGNRWKKNDLYRHDSSAKDLRTIVGLLDSHLQPKDFIVAALKLANIPQKNWEQRLRAEALTLPGWAGTFATLSHQAQIAHVGSVRLIDFIAIRLFLSMLDSNQISEATQPMIDRYWIARELYLVVQEIGLTFLETKDWSVQLWTTLWEDLSNFTDRARRRCLHRAYEAHFANNLLCSIKSHNNKRRTIVKKPIFQAVFCIDDREESLRRHIEESCPESLTYGAAGFFGIDMNYQAADAEHGVPLCPVVVKPTHLVKEHPAGKVKRRGATGKLLHEGSRRFLSGALMTPIAGVLAAIPLATRVLLPGFKWTETSDRSDSTLLEFEFTGKQTADGQRLGFTVLEMADRVQGILTGIGLTDNFAPIIALFGHGSNSLNNPHESAYDCGACGGRRGAPNARVFALMANLNSVRTELAKRGISIPKTTWVVGGFHDTCSDEVQYFDLDKVPSKFDAYISKLQETLHIARDLDAGERCRRFTGARGLSASKALKHVAGRCKDLREPRPEYGHSSNASLVVGRRDITRGLFLDRRSFLVSYDYTRTGGAATLSKILGAVIPVCAGISLEYFFSYIDNERYGCGTKLPHNIVGLMGVMNGFASDLRTGLTWQMVEIHEPMRLVVIVESTRTTTDLALESLPAVRNLIEKEWIRFFVYESFNQEYYSTKNGEWTLVKAADVPLQQVKRSLDYAVGSHHLAPVQVLGGDVI